MYQGRKNPFRPGAGEAPPHRAGHKDEERVLLKRVGRLVDEEPGGMVVLYGPRGIGKTVLMTEIQTQAAGQDIQVRALNPNNWGDNASDFVERLASAIDINKFQVKGNVEIDLIVAKLKVSCDPTVSKVTADEVLCLMAKAKPVALFVDEAHELPSDIATHLLNAVQECVRQGVQLLLVLAGTPEIRANLGRADASFWERATRVRLGRLESKDATRIALSLPAESSGLPFAPDALEFLVEESQDYPYFIQLVGEQSWDAAIARDPDAAHVGLEDAQAGVLAANKTRDELCAGRLQEVNNRRMLREAVAVSKAFRAIGGDGVLPGTELERALMPLLAGDRTVHDILEELFAVGLVWQTDDHALWAPGIPSLCTYITEHALTGGHSGGVPAS